MNRTHHRLATLLLLTAASLPATADSGIEWRHRAAQGPVTLSANPLSGEQRSAFYQARGFATAAIRPYASACGFSIGMQNSGTTTIATRLADWRAVDAAGRIVHLRLPETWDADWNQASVAPAARIAFRWAQFQAANTFEPGDWIMGMATFESPPTPPFRLLARYHDNTGSHEITLEGLHCAAE